MIRFCMRTAALAVVVSLATIAAVSPVHAHSLLIRSDPAQDARLFESPAAVSGWFSEPLEAGVSSLKVVDASGARVDQADTRIDPGDPSKMTVSLRPGLGPGFYLVTWETLSRVDGHFRFGSYQFAVLNTDGSLPPPPAFGDVGGGGDEVDIAISLVKGLSLIGQIGMVGALAFFFLVAQPAAKSLAEPARASSLHLSRRQLTLAGFASVGLLGLTGLLELLVQMSDVPGGSGLGEILATSWGDRWLQRQVALIAVGVLLVGHNYTTRRGPGSWLVALLALLASFGYLLLTSLTSHAAALQRGDFWATSFDFLHLLTAAFWIGGLAQLAALSLWTRSQPEEPARTELRANVLRRFSLFAATAAVPLLATGILNALIQVPSFSDLVDTSYGLTLVAKTFVVVLLLAVAALNAFVLRPGFIRAAGEGRPTQELARLLQRLVPVEAALGALVLVVTGVLTQLTTARALAQITGKIVEPGAALANPLAAADFGLVLIVALIALGTMGLVWTSQAPGCSGWLVRNLSRAAVALPSLVLLFVVLNAALGDDAGRGPGATDQRAFQPQLSLLTQASEDKFVSLQVDPFQLGDNLFKVTVLGHGSRPAPVEQLALRFSRLERQELVGEVAGTFDATSGSYLVRFSLAETGWWAIEAQAGDSETATFYVRLDDPSRAPDSFAPPAYPSDTRAEAAFDRALEKYQALSSIRWHEQLTSGHGGPGGLGVWFLTAGEAVAPDGLHFQVFSLEGLRSDRYFVGSTECSATDGAPMDCSVGSFRPDVLDLDFLQPKAFKLGRREAVDGEMTQVLLFYNPNQQAWYAWWVGEQSGSLRRQAMVAPGHFMLASYTDHNQAISIRLPEGVVP